MTARIQLVSRRWQQGVWAAPQQRIQRMGHARRPAWRAWWLTLSAHKLQCFIEDLHLQHLGQGAFFVFGGTSGK